jgi:hypothetical protein
MLPVLLLLAAAPPEVAVLSTPGAVETTELRFQRPGETLAPAAAHFDHVKGSTVLGSLLPGTHTVLAIAQTVDARDPSWAASLVRLEPGKPAVTLTDRVALSTRPLVTRDGRVLVQRGRAAEGTSTITIDEIDPRTGAARTIHSFSGHTAFIAGAFEGEVLLYRVGASGADLVAVHRDALSVRTLVPSMVALARDFTTDGRALYFTTADRDGWLVARVDLKTGEQRVMARGGHVALLPTLLPEGLALSAGPGEGLRYLDGTAALLPLNRGFERVLAQRAGFAFALHELPSDFPSAYAVELKTGRVLTIAAPAEARLDLAGVAE